MNPPQCRREEDLIYDINTWLDESRELVNLGEAELPSSYKITSLKRIATDKVREELEEQEVGQEVVQAESASEPELESLNNQLMLKDELEKVEKLKYFKMRRKIEILEKLRMLNILKS